MFSRLSREPSLSLSFAIPYKERILFIIPLQTHIQKPGLCRYLSSIWSKRNYWKLPRNSYSWNTDNIIIPLPVAAAAPNEKLHAKG